ncbi:MAG: AI-2E family transporter, partial [Sphingobacteriales bacterium]
MQHTLMQKTVRLLALLTFSIVALYYAQSFLIPLAFAGLLSMLLLPVSKWFEAKGISHGLSALISLLLLVTIGAGIIVLLAWQ